METESYSDYFVRVYKRAEDAEAAWTEYQLNLSKPDRDALDKDFSKVKALIGLFYGAKDPAKLERYAGMTVDELVQLAADTDAANLAKLDADDFAKTVADLEEVDPDRLARAKASLEKMRQAP